MCGIVGYIGKRPAFPILLSGLRRLIYRGYDSFGFAFLNDQGEISCFKKPGRLDEEERELARMNFEGSLGIAHCLTPDTLVQMADGRVLEISEIDEKDKVLALDPETLELREAEARPFKHESPKYLYEIKTSSAFLRTTGEHRMLVFSGGKVKEKRVREISKRDLLIFPKKIRIKGKKLKFKECFVKRYYRIGEEINQSIRVELEERFLTKEAAAIQIGISRSYMDHLIRNDRNFREDQLQKILPFLTSNPSLDHLAPVNTTQGKFVSLPTKSSPELMQILGYLLGDGSVGKKCIRFKDLNKNLLLFYKGLIEKVFNVEGRVVSQKDTRAYLLEVNSFYLCNWLRENIVSRKKDFLKEVGQLSNKEIATFLKGLFDAEGCVNLVSKQISLRLTDRNIVKIAQFLLLRFGIITSFHKEDRKYKNWNDYFGLYISDYNTFKKFAKEINFSSKEKNKKLKLLIEKQVRNVMKKDGGLFDVAPQKILRIRKIKSNTDYLYDLEVFPHSNFIANGLLSHNSRWATTGIVSEENSHPQFDCNKEIFLVHNGIVENYQELKEELIREGHKFSSETDTEIFCHLIEKYFKGNLEEAVREALRGIRGNYAIAVISKKDPNKIVLAKFGAPLLIGISDGEYFVASDPAALVSYTRQVINLDDNEIAVVSPGNHFVLKEKPIEKIDWEIKGAEKKGFSHFMLKEIFEEPGIIGESIRGRIDLENGLARLGGLEQAAERLRKIEKMILIGCGTAKYAAQVGEYMLEEYAEIPTKVECSSEFRYKKPVLDEKTAVLAISQSGETADTLEAVKEVKRKGSLALGLVNVVGSSIARETDAGVYNRVGPEIGVAATKSFVSQLAILALATVSLGRKREMSLVTGKRILEELQKLPDLAQRILDRSDHIRELARKYSEFRNFYFLGRKYNQPIAFEGALKLKEIAWKIHAEGASAGEMKHGMIALIDENLPTVCIIPSDSVYEKMKNAVMEIKARKGKVLAIATEGNEEIKNMVDDVIYIPKTLEMLTPILAAVPLHLFAAYLGLELGLDIDKPRNLAKSVTVE